MISAGGMLGEIVRTALEHEPEVELVPAAMWSQLTRPERAAVDVLVMVLPGGEVVSECRAMMSQYPNVRIMAALEDERGDADLFELGALRVRLGSLSPAEVARTISAATRT